MPINPTYLAATSRSSLSAADARSRVLSLYRAWQRGAPSILELYSLDVTIPQARNKIRREFEKNRFVTSLPAIDVLHFKGYAEYHETMNFFKQVTHIMKYFRIEEEPRVQLPTSFVGRFLEGRN